MPVDKIRVSGDARFEYKSATVNGHKYSEYSQQPCAYGHLKPRNRGEFAKYCAVSDTQTLKHRLPLQSTSVRQVPSYDLPGKLHYPLKAITSKRFKAEFSSRSMASQIFPWDGAIKSPC